MREEALEKRHTGEGDPAHVRGPILPIAERDLSVLDPFQTAVGDGDAEDVPAQVVEDRLAAPGGLTVDDPRRRPDLTGHLIEYAGVVEGRADLRPEDLRQRLNRDERAPVRRGDPRGAISGEPPGGDEPMDVGMIEQGASPRMEDGETAEPSPPYRASRASVRRAAAARFISSP